MTKKDSVDKKVTKKEEVAGVETEDKPVETPAENNEEANKVPYALVFTFILFISGVMGIVLMSNGDKQKEVTSEPAVEEPVATAVADNPMMNNQNRMAEIFAERRKEMQQRRQAASMNNNSSAVNHASSGNNMRNNMQPPAWVKEQREQMQKQMMQNAGRDGLAVNRTPAAEVPAWVKERQAMFIKQQEQRQKQMMAYHQQWLKSQQMQQPRMYMQPGPRAPMYYNPNGYYPPAPYYGPRR